MSEKSISQRLFIKSGFRVALIGAPDDFIDKIGQLPENVVITRAVGKNTNIVLAFVENKLGLIDFLENLYKDNKELMIWIAYPKGTSKVKTDINRDIIVKISSEYELKAVAMISIDEKWASLRLKLV